MDIINPSNEQASGKITLGNEDDVERAVAAARPALSATSREERVAIMDQIAEESEKRTADLVVTISEEMGAPDEWAKALQVGYGGGHIKIAADILRTFVFEEKQGDTVLRREPIGVCALVTPWNPKSGSARSAGSTPATRTNFVCWSVPVEALT